MILFAKQPFVPAAAPRPQVDEITGVLSVDLTTLPAAIPAAWPVAVSTLAQKFMACQIREMHGRRD